MFYDILFASLFMWKIFVKTWYCCILMKTSRLNFIVLSTIKKRKIVIVKSNNHVVLIKCLSQQSTKHENASSERWWIIKNNKSCKTQALHLTDNVSPCSLHFIC